ncbi:MAG: recombinase family protein, partial [Ruminococcus sp.]
MNVAKKLNCVIYARYSSTNQKEQSIEGQLRECKAYAERNGYTVVGEYVDKAMSGRSDHRPDFQKMISDAKKGQFQYIIVWKLDRFARNRYDSAVYKNKLKKSGVRVLSATEGLGEGSESIIIEGILESYAEYYSVNLAENTRRGMEDTARHGFVTGSAPYGYKIVDKKLAIDDKTAPAVQLAFDMFAKGNTKSEIAAALNDKGYATKFGKKWTCTSFDNIFKNRVYIGDYTYKGEIPRSCPRLISDDIFNKCQQKLEMSRRMRGQKKTDDIDFLLSGKCFCGNCGSPMFGDSGTSRNGDKHYYYTCHGRKKHRSGCKKKSEKKDFLEWYVVEQTVNYILAAERIDYVAERVVAKYKELFNESGIRELEARLQAIDKELDGCANALIASSVPSLAAKINEKAENLQIQKEDLEIELAKAKISNRAELTEQDVLKYLNKFRGGDLFDEKYRREIIDTFINSVIVYDDKIIIYFNLKDGQQISFIEPSELDIDSVPECSDSSAKGEPQQRGCKKTVKKTSRDSLKGE